MKFKDLKDQVNQLALPDGAVLSSIKLMRESPNGFKGIRLIFSVQTLQEVILTVAPEDVPPTPE